MVDPVSTAALLAAAKKHGPQAAKKAASAVEKKVLPADWATELARKTTDGMPRPHPRWSLARDLQQPEVFTLLCQVFADRDTWPVEGLAIRLETAIWHWWHRTPVAERRAKSHEIAETVLRHFLESLNPSLAVSLSHTSLSERISEFRDEAREDNKALQEAIAVSTDRILEAMPEASRDSSEIGVGSGDATWFWPFTQLFNAITPVRLGEATTHVEQDGPGVYQRYVGVWMQHGGYVMCALPNQAPLVVPDGVWCRLHEIGSGSLIDGGLNAIGYPTLPADRTGSDRMIDEDAINIELDGGLWGPGRLVRTEPAESWRWEPILRESMRTPRYATHWTGGFNGPDLRVRAVAALPWNIKPSALVITSSNRARLVSELHTDELNSALTELLTRRGIAAAFSPWEETQDYGSQSRDAATYMRTLCAPDGRLALELHARLTVQPSGDRLTVLACTELALHAAAWETTANSASAQPWQLSISEVRKVLTAAWASASDILPRATGIEPRLAPPAGPPVLELHLLPERPVPSRPGPNATLNDLLDLSAFGRATSPSTQRMSIAITSAPGQDHAFRHEYCRGALARLAQDHGFIDADEADL